MNIKIYQISPARDTNRVKFLSLSQLQKFQGGKDINAAIYDEVYSGEVACNNLEEVYNLFNIQPPPLHRGHSLSISDIVVNAEGAFYCEPMGFYKVDFDAALAHKSENLLRVVYVEPNKPAYESEIENTLKAKQRAVSGYIEVVSNADNTCLICNEEAKLLGMEGNRRLDDGTSIIAGPFFIIGEAGPEFRSLTDEEAKRYLERFSEPETITQDEVEQDLGFEIITFE